MVGGWIENQDGLADNKLRSSLVMILVLYVD